MPESFNLTLAINHQPRAGVLEQDKWSKWGLYMIYEKRVVPARIAWKRFPGWQESFSVLTQKSMTSFFNHRGAYINIETKSTIMHS